MKKRFFAVLLCVIMALSMVACGDSDADKKVGQPSITKLADYKDFEKILTGDYAVTDEKIKDYFSSAVYGAGIGLVEVKDRDTVQAGDIVKTDYTGYLNGEAFTGGTAKDQWIDVSNNCGIDTESGQTTSSFIDGFTDGLVGAKIGQKTSSDVTFPANYGNADLAGKPTTFEFNVTAIYVELTPDTITDAMVAEKLKEDYEVTTVADFMKLMKGELAYNLVVNSVIANSTFDIPADYLELRLDEYQALFEELYCSTMDIETFLSQYYGMTLETIRAQWKVAMEDQIKAELAFEAIVKEEGLKTNQDALAEYVKTVTTSAGTSEGNPFFTKEANVYKMLGVGNEEEGKAYFLNQNASKDFVMENYQ